MVDVPVEFRDLLDAPVASLATLSADGRPQVTAVWFLHEDGALRISLNTARQKVRNLRRNPACTLFVLDVANPLRYLEIRGDAEIAPDDEYEFAGRLGAKYNADVRSFDPPGQTRVAVTVVPTKVNAVNIGG